MYIIKSKLSMLKYQLSSSPHCHAGTPIETKQYTPIKLCADTTDSSEDPKHASKEAKSKNEDALVLGSLYIETGSIVISLGGTSNCEHYCTCNCYNCCKHLDGEHKSFYAVLKTRIRRARFDEYASRTNVHGAENEWDGADHCCCKDELVVRK